MKLTRKKAIELSIKKWERLAETGKREYSNCTLCEYTIKNNDNWMDNCDTCPYDKKFGDCCEIGSPFLDWFNCKSDDKRKQYANEFLEQLKALK